MDARRGLSMNLVLQFLWISLGIVTAWVPVAGAFYPIALILAFAWLGELSESSGVFLGAGLALVVVPIASLVLSRLTDAELGLGGDLWWINIMAGAITVGITLLATNVVLPLLGLGIAVAGPPAAGYAGWVSRSSRIERRCISLAGRELCVGAEDSA
jgi:hypothetical protein